MRKKEPECEARMSGLTRRRFIQSTAALAGLALVTPVSQVFGANDRLRLAICGARSRGNALMRGFLDQENVEVAWIVDPDVRVLERRSEEVRERTGKKPKATTDVRKALEDPGVDALVVATPNHWHSLMVVWAAQAGKHCYVEKPASHDIYEGRVALEAAQKYGVVVQHGTQRRSSRRYADLIQAIHSGKYGRLTVSHGFACKPRNGIGHQPVAEPPEWLDWNLWRGHVPIDEFHANLAHYNWHWFWATGSGELNNQGTHQLDVAYWALDPEMHSKHPVSATALGGRFAWGDQGETPNSMFAVAEYPNGQKVVMNIRNVSYDGYVREVENRYYFEDGGKIVGGEYISPGGERQPVEGEAAEITPGGEFGSFVRACRAGKPGMVNASMQDGHYSSALGHVMNISYRLGRELPFNEKAGRFGDDAKVAEEFIDFHEIMRDGVGVPEDEEKYIVGPRLIFDSETERFVGERAAEANHLVRDPRRKEFDLPEPEKV